MVIFQLTPGKEYIESVIYVDGYKLIVDRFVCLGSIFATVPLMMRWHFRLKKHSIYSQASKIESGVKKASKSKKDWSLQCLCTDIGMLNSWSALSSAVCVLLWESTWSHTSDSKVLLRVTQFLWKLISTSTGCGALNMSLNWITVKFPNRYCPEHWRLATGHSIRSNLLTITTGKSSPETKAHGEPTLSTTSRPSIKHPKSRQKKKVAKKERLTNPDDLTWSCDHVCFSWAGLISHQRSHQWQWPVDCNAHCKADLSWPNGQHVYTSWSGLTKHKKVHDAETNAPN